MEAQSAGLPDPLTSIIWIFGRGGNLRTSVYSGPINDLEVLRQRVQNACQEIRMKPEYAAECAPLCEEEPEVVWKCMGATRNIRCGDHTNVTHISAGTGFCTHIYVDWAFFLI
jgi:hypothetical protein